MSSPINVVIDNESVADELVSCEISGGEGDFCLSVSLELKSQLFWSNCDPSANQGELRIKVVIGSNTYEFLCEERTTTLEPDSVGFRVWGRSKQAYLGEGYADSINDTESTSHPWQTGNVKVSDIISHLLTNYVSQTVTVNWNALDYIVYQNVLSLSEQYPIDVIRMLANSIGAEIIANADGSLSIETYSVEEGVSVESYTDLDDIIVLDENVDKSKGYNSVVVSGYDSGSKASPYMALSVIGTTWRSFSEDGTIYLYRDLYLRLYHYHPDNVAIISYFPDGTVEVSGTGLQEVTEYVNLVWGKGNTTYPKEDGTTEVSGDEEIPFTYVEVTYNRRYTDYYIPGGALLVLSSYRVMWYFEDKSAHATYSPTLEDPVEEGTEPGTGVGGWGICGSIVIVDDSGGSVDAGQTADIKVYSPASDVTSAVNSEGSSVNRSSSGKTETKSESITFTNGEGTLSFPVKSDVNVSGTGAPLWTLGSNKIFVNEWRDNPSYASMTRTVSYKTEYETWSTSVPQDCQEPIITINFGFSGGCTGSVTISVNPADEEESDQRTTYFTIKNYVGGTVLEGVSIYVDNIFKGVTNADGQLSVDLPIGDHILKMTKPGYTDSDQDDLDNSDFTVE